MKATRDILFPFVGGDVVGGSHLSALNLISALDRDRFRPRIVLHGGDGLLARVIADHGLEWERIDGPGIIAPSFSRQPGDVSLLRYAMFSIAALRRRLQAWDIDLVHTNDGRMHGSWALPARLAGCRLVWHHRQDPTALGVNIIAPLLADRIVSVSRFARPARPIRPIEKRFRVIHSPFDLPDVRPDRVAARAALRAAIGAGSDAAVVGYVGTLTARKRPAHFVKVLAKLARAMPDRDVHGAVFGKPKRTDDPVVQQCMALASDLGVADRLHMMGHRSPIDPWLAGLDALLVTALGEPFGRTLIEAMHLSVPVVATRHGGNPEAVRDGVTGFLVDPDDAAAFVQPVCELLTVPDLARRITTAAATGLERFSTAAHVQQIEALYADLLDEPDARNLRTHHV